jgi:MFS family permease
MLISLNAVLVVALQLAITRWTDRYRPMRMLALGTLLYGIGFGLFGLPGSYPLFISGIVILTFGEMIVIPISQSVSSVLAPEDMRGRYATVFGYAWGLPSLFGPYLAGVVMDQWDPRWLWAICGLLGALGAIGFLTLIRPAEQRLHSTPAQ